MKKRMLAAIVLCVAVLSLQAQAPPQQQMKLEEVERALSLVDKPEPVPDKYRVGLESITARDSIAMLSFLASDWTEGRETGSRGFRMAAEYVEGLFKMWGVKPGGDMPAPGAGRMGGPGGTPTGTAAAARERSYFQEFALRSTSDAQSSISVEVNVNGAVKTRVFHGGVDYQSVGRGGNIGTLTAPVVFAGYGIQEPSIGWDELKGLNLKGRVVLLLTEAPGRDNPQSPFQQNKELKDRYFPAAPGPAAMPPMPARGPEGAGQRFNKLAAIEKLGAQMILQVQNTGRDADIYRNLSAVRQPSDDRPIINRTRMSLSIPGAGGPMGGGVPTLTITREMADAILEATGQTIDDLKRKIETDMKPASMDLGSAKVTLSTTAKASLLRTFNIIGYIEGSDPKLKDEYFVVGAHFDHLGKWEDYVFNGADDNASGSVGVMNIARAMAVNPVKPKRSVVFALWTGEENGLLGSRYYTLNPSFPIEKTVGYLNYDMISRAYDQTTIARTLRQYSVPGAENLVKRIRAPWFVTVNLTADTDFIPLVREMNKYVGLDLALRENPLGQGSGGSDHASFARVKIPFVYYMAAMTSDYHQTSDSVEKVSGELLAKISQHGYLTVFAFADK